jgi:mannose-6-phosphate isomerase-like protein (cupin superfamily)
MGYHVVKGDEHAWEERPSQREGEPPRQQSDMTTQVQLTQSRARVFRYPPGTRGRRHKNFQQEEVFVVLEGTLTMLLGEPPERVDLPPRSVCKVETDTPLQLFNAGDEDVTVFIYGAPPATDQSEMLEDLALE